MLWLALACAGCTTAPSSGNSDGAVPDLTTTEIITRFCTTSACAMSPCTPGCVFNALVGSCSGTLSAEVDVATVKKCSPRFCGLFHENPFGSLGLGCGVYHGEFPGCEACGFRWGDPSCVVVDPILDYDTGGAICTDTCFDGRAPEDMALNCSDHDMYPQRWDLSM
jgi:hypothetical protein